MFNRQLKMRVAELERRLNKVEQKQNCKEGKHIWIMSESCFDNKPPFIRCSECWALLEPPKQSAEAKE